MESGNLCNCSVNDITLCNGNFIKVFQGFIKNIFQYKKQFLGAVSQTFKWRTYVCGKAWLLSSYDCNKSLASEKFPGANCLSPGGSK